MIKKISTYMFLITFSSVVSAQEILMDCKTGKYRYINNDSVAKILYTHKKRDKGKWAGWCPAEVNEKNKSWFVSAKDHNLLISENKGICMVSEAKFKMANGKVGIIRSSTSVVDFTKKTYTAEYFWMDEKKKFKKTTKCKIAKN
jgi:hypothetical protein